MRILSKLKTNRLIGRLFEMVYLTFFIATSHGVELGGRNVKEEKGGFELTLSFQMEMGVLF